MLSYLRAKKESLEAQKKPIAVFDEEIEKEVEKYRVNLYTAKEIEINELNKAIDAKVDLLNELIEDVEAASVEETETVDVESEVVD